MEKVLRCGEIYRQVRLVLFCTAYRFEFSSAVRGFDGVL